MAVSRWTREYRLKIERAFYAFLNRCFVNSKDYGQICLGENLYDGQIRLITAVFDSLEHDIHKVFILKSRQLGISTISRALSMFLIGVHPGLKGAIVFDTDQNRNEARAELETMIRDLPASLRFPGIASSNRSGLSLANDSKVLFMSAGTRKSKTSGTLGRSVGLSLAHLSELCSYDNDEGLVAFENSLSDMNPDRLYIYESTARGHNTWYDIWQRAREDPAHCCCVFLGWWSKPSQKIARDDRDFALYGKEPPTESELRKIGQVRELYDTDITVEQLAWIRRKMDPGASQVADNTGDPDEEDSALIQEQPWTEDEAFQISGSKFFTAASLQDQTEKHVSTKWDGYTFIASEKFIDLKIFTAEPYRHPELRVWEAPDSNSVYVIGCDPAYGSNDRNDRSSIQVGRCYADGIDQVAEYASPMINTQQLAWVLASLLGWYSAGRSEARYILELNGPGEAVFTELRSLRHQIENNLGGNYGETGLRDVFRNVKTYIYSRADSMGSGQNYHFKTTSLNKIPLFENLRSFVMNGVMRVRSRNAIKEMSTVARNEGSIGADSRSKRDDCVMALALMAHYWDTGPRRALITQRKTREAEAAVRRATVTDTIRLFNQNHLQAMFDRKRKERTQMQTAMIRSGWRQAPGRRFR